MEPVIFELRKESDGLFSYDARISRDEASAGDYLDAINGFQERFVAPCDGCANCCWERVPLTAPDARRYAAELYGPAPDTGDRLSAAKPIGRFIAEYGQVYEQGDWIDIQLRRRPDGSCVFLDQAARRCRLHHLRPLVCQSYICLPSSRRAAALRQKLVNEGENELVWLWLLSLPEAAPAALASLYRGGAFEGKSAFSQVSLREAAGPGLWQKLRR
ncbi:MAG: YkgJ family cysteine cluster protein [Peptococcaceae bacterium]|nr:YkgJ family cysteine cluster protein [Peptococcaceae bacterium]